MPGRIYALLVGINDYGPEVGRLGGCLADVEEFHACLRRYAGSDTLAVEVLTNADATRLNVVERFRAHLGRAAAGDVALFQFCGHGARWASNAAFREFYPDGKDEGLVCVDSRQPGGFDLADKELAVMVADVARRDAHVALVFDCCHSGSGTRGTPAAAGLTPRLTHDVTTERPLGSYLDGHYAALRAAGEPLSVPTGRHILLAACERGQLAQELAGHGIFTSTLIEVLEKSGGTLSYADLFVRCRTAVRSRALDQDPQFETYGRFDARAGFLGRALAGRPRRRYLTYVDRGTWKVECGAVMGVPTTPGSAATFALYDDGGASAPAGTARTIAVGAQTSTLALDFDSSPSQRYVAELTSLPAAPLPVAFAGDEAARTVIQQVFDEHAPSVHVVGAHAATVYALSLADARLTFGRTDDGTAIAHARVTGSQPHAAALQIAPAVQHVADWTRALALRNPRPSIDSAQVEVEYAGAGADALAVDTDTDAVLHYAGAPLRGRFRIRQGTGRPLHAALIYFSGNYGVHVLANELVQSGADWMTLWGAGPRDYLFLPDGVDDLVERFKIFAAVERLDDFLLAQPDLAPPDRGFTREDGPETGPVPVVQTNGWFTRDLRFRLARRRG